MSTNTELIKKVDEACTRVLKQCDFSTGVVNALSLVVMNLTDLRDKIQAAGEIDANISNEMWGEIYEMGRVLESIYNGYPMVPAEDVATFAVDNGECCGGKCCDGKCCGGESCGAECCGGCCDMVDASEVIGMCADKLEKAALMKDALAAAAEVAIVKIAVAKLAALGDAPPQDAKIPMLKSSGLAKLAKACGDKNMDQKAKKAKDAEEAKKRADAEQRAVAKIEGIAKAAEPTPTAPAAPATSEKPFRFRF